MRSRLLICASVCIVTKYNLRKMTRQACEYICLVCFNTTRESVRSSLQVHGTRHCNIMSCFRYMLREGGILSLWRGNGINVLKIAPEHALKFMSYEHLKQVIKAGDDGREIQMYERFCAGSTAGGISQSVVYPLEVYLAISNVHFGGLCFFIT